MVATTVVGLILSGIGLGGFFLSLAGDGLCGASPSGPPREKPIVAYGTA